MKPAAFLFDMDGLLLDTERLFLQSFLKLTAQIGVPNTVAEPFFMTLVGTSSKTTSIRLAELLPQSVDPRAFETKWRDMHAQKVSKGATLKPNSHKIPEVFELTDRTTILRQGRVVFDGDTSELNVAAIAQHITGSKGFSSAACGRERKQSASSGSSRTEK